MGPTQWLAFQGTRRRWRGSVALGGLAVALCLAVLPALADTPESGLDPNVTLTVTPSDFLTDGQVVTVTGAGFTPNTAGTTRECGGTVAAPQCDLTVMASFVTTASGEIPPTSVTVERIIDTGTTTFNCGVQACALVATAGERTSQHHIRMAGAGTSVPTTTSTTAPTTTTSASTSSTSTTSIPPSGPPTNKDQCKDDGWQGFGFKNQGRCVSAVASQRQG